MKDIRFGIIGYGNIAHTHLKNFDDRKVSNGAVTAIFDIDEKKIALAKATYGDRIMLFTDENSFFDSHLFDAILICTPHYFHSGYAIRGFKEGLHVLCEKPAGVYTKQVGQMNEAHAKHPELVFSMMYNQRTNPIYKKVHDMILSNEMGAIKRCVWIITDWFRSQRYYDSGGWRATWEGEGGGVLLNQDPHQLDLWQWICGMPKRVRAFCAFGKYHDIEVEDDVTAYVEYENGATGVFITTTGEAPGTNRFEIDTDLGKIVIENNKIMLYKLETGIKKYTFTSDKAFGTPPCEVTEVTAESENPGHLGIVQNFINAILNGENLIAPGEEGIKGLTISNAMMLSTWTDSWVDIPFDEDRYYRYLQERIRSSKFRKNVTDDVKVDMSESFKV